MVDKPEVIGSSPENEYFYKLNQEAIEKYRKKLDEERRRQQEEYQKQLHWMKCPKCGHDLVEQNLRGVMIDSCTNCRGIFLDNGELDLLKKVEYPKNFFLNLSDMIFKRDKVAEKNS